MSLDKLKSHIGERYNMLTIIDVVRPDGYKQAVFKCQCDCGNAVYAFPYQVYTGKTKSCGCYKQALLVATRRTHGGSKSPLYLEWRSMVSRCHNPESYNFKDYGGRGITVCDAWRNSPQAFYDWVDSTGGRPNRATLDRINNNGPYSPENCVWATMHQQSRNKRSNIFVTYQGRTKCLADWAEELGLSHETLRYRYHRGMTPEQILHKGPLPNSGRFKPKAR